MYETLFAQGPHARRVARFTFVICALALGLGVGVLAAADLQSPQLIYQLTDANNRLELTTNTSRILTLDKNIPRVQVNNPELLAVTPLSANQVQIAAKMPGVTQVNLWDEDGQIHTVDILIYGDIAELEAALRTQFPDSSIRIYRYSKTLALKGFVANPEHVAPIMKLVRNYAPDPEIVNNISVGGVQQVLLKVRVMEISRTKLRNLGVDWAYLGASGDFAVNSVSGLIDSFTHSGVVTTGSDTFAFGIVDGANDFFGVLDALEQRKVAKVLAEPNLVAVSGRPAQFNVGGEFPILVPQSLGTTSVEFKKFGTQVDFLPIVLGNGNIRLEVRPRISELDFAASVTINGVVIPGLTVREVDTAVEMKAGQTFALAGLVQERTESQFDGLPYISDLPVIGVPFRRVHDQVNEIELLILVTPEFVDAIEPHEVACGGPGFETTVPNNCDLYCGGHLEVPTYCNPIRGMTACGECPQGACGCGPNGPADSIISDGTPIEGGTGYDDSYVPTPLPPTGPNGPAMEPDSMSLPPATQAEPLPPQSSRRFAPAMGMRQMPAAGADYTVPRPYSPSRQPVFVRNAASPDNPTADHPPQRMVPGDSAGPSAAPGGLFGPVGYDAQ